MTHGIKVSQDGYDARVASDEHLLLKSDFTLLKVFSQGTAATSGGDIDISHNLGYVPQFLVYMEDLLASEKADVSFLLAGRQDLGYAYADTSKLYIRPNMYGGDSYYYIFYEQA